MDSSNDDVLLMADEVITVLHTTAEPEFQAITKVTQSLDLVTQKLKKRETNMKHRIEEMTRDCEAESDRLDEQITDSQEAELQQVLTDIKQADVNKKNVLRQIEELETRKQKLHKASTELQSERARVEQKTVKGVGSIRRDINLYNYIAGIKWQFDCEPEEIKGYICNNGRVRTFELNTKQNSQFFIRNYLWDLMEPVW